MAHNVQMIRVLREMVMVVREANVGGFNESLASHIRGKSSGQPLRRLNERNG